MEYLIKSQFYDWITFLLNKHFRLELNFSVNRSIPKLSDLFTANNSQLERRLLQSDFELQDALNRDDVKGMNELQAEPVQESEELKAARKKANEWFQ